MGLRRAVGRDASFGKRQSGETALAGKPPARQAYGAMRSFAPHPVSIRQT